MKDRTTPIENDWPKVFISSMRHSCGPIYHRQDFNELLILQDGVPVKSFNADGLQKAGEYARNLYAETEIPVECRYVLYKSDGPIIDQWIYFYENQNQSVGEYIICFLDNKVNGSFLAGLWNVSEVMVQQFEKSGREIARKQERKEARTN